MGNENSQTNHLIIGLGGTGGKIIAAYRKKIVEKYSEPNPHKTRKIEYLWIDSSKVEMDQKGGIWSAMGQDISLGLSQKMLIQASALGEAVNDRTPIDNNLKPWIGKQDDWGFLAQNEGGAHAAGGQIRRLGRYNFSQFINQFKTSITNAISKLRTDNNSPQITVHIIAGLAGGTGSGAVVDVAAQILKEFNEDIVVLIYGVAPLKNPPSSHMGKYGNVSFYHANGYAALRELNGYLSSWYSPFDIADNSPEPVRANTQNTPNNIFLFTEETYDGRLLSPKITTGKIADILFVRTILVQSSMEGDAREESNGLGEMLGRVDRGENRVVPPEINWGMMNKLSSLSSQSLFIPKQDIKYYFGYNLILNSLNKILYDNFEKDTGYVEWSSQSDVEFQLEANSVKENRGNIPFVEELFITSNHLKLERNIPGNPFGDWSKKNLTPHEEIKQHIDRTSLKLESEKRYKGKEIVDNEILKYLQIEINHYMNNSFRSEGLGSYYNRMYKDENLVQISEFMQKTLHSKIHISKGDVSTASLFRWQKRLDLFLTDYLPQIKINSTKLAKINRASVKKLEQELEVLKQEYLATFGVLKGVFRKDSRQRNLEAFKAKLLEYYAHKASELGATYSLKLIDSYSEKIGEEIQELKCRIESLEEIRDRFQRLYNDKKEHVKDHKSDSFECSNGDGVGRLEKALKRSKVDFDKVINRILATISTTGKQIDADKVEEESLKKVLEILTADSIGDLIGKDDFYDINIIDYLCSKYDGDVKDRVFQNLLDNLILYSRPMLKYNSKSYNTPSVYAIMPVYDRANDSGEGARFLTDLNRELEARGIILQQGITNDEIVFLQIGTDIDLNGKTVDRIKFLKEQYDEVINSPSCRNASFLLHIQNGDSLVDLIDPDYDQYITLIMPWLLCIENSGGFEIENEELVIVNRDKDGMRDDNSSLNLHTTDLLDLMKIDFIKRLFAEHSFFLIYKRFKEVWSREDVKGAIERVRTIIIEHQNSGVSTDNREYKLYQKIYSKLKGIIQN